MHATRGIRGSGLRTAVYGASREASLERSTPGGARDTLDRGRYPTPSRAPTLYLATLASMSFVTDSNRPPTALATPSNRLPNRFWGHL